MSFKHEAQYAEIKARITDGNIGNPVAESRSDIDRGSHWPYHITTRHHITTRPWGTYSVVASGTRWRTKVLVVDPGKSTSLQRHLHRMERWMVVEGTMVAKTDTTTKSVFEGGDVTVNRHVWHQIHNPGKIPLVIVETWVGDYLEEDDIERWPTDEPTPPRS